MATIIGMAQILNRKDSTLTNKKRYDRMDCLMMVQLTYFLVLKDYILYYCDVHLML